MSAIPSAKQRGPHSASLVVMGCLLLAGSASAQTRPAGDKGSQAKPVAGDKSSSPALEYVIGAGDVLHIFVWKEPELSRDVAVRVDGKITVPLLGDVEAAGRTPQQLGKDLGRELARFLETPQVTLGVMQPLSSRFFILGQVSRPGDFPLQARVNILQALAIAGGFKEYAKTDSIVIIREDKGTQTVIPVNYKKLEAGKDMTQNVPIQPGDVIIVP